ncbi:MAG: aminotransferase class IV [Wenzhouxiangella sp.]|nr:MAG: aminotransferase class IV [Wenzhouxiangella sp.]
MVDEDQATISVFDSGFVLGDGVWEGLRVASGQPAFLEPHLDRLYATAKAIMLDVGLSRDQLSQAIEQTIAANQLIDDAHLRVMVTRGVRRQPYQDPRLALGSATVVIVPALSPHDPAAAARGLDLFTVHVRRGPPDVQDQKINSHSKFNCIMACIQANQAGADEALMLDPRGFVATCNSTHFFIVRSGEVWTSAGGYCLGGITRANVLALCRDHGIPGLEKDFSLTDVYGAEECFVTGTLGGITPVRQVDGRRFEGAVPGPVTARLQGLYSDLIRADVASRDQGPARVSDTSGPGR